jgi:hypothetical protein
MKSIIEYGGKELRSRGPWKWSSPHAGLIENVPKIDPLKVRLIFDSAHFGDSCK